MQIKIVSVERPGNQKKIKEILVDIATVGALLMFDIHPDFAPLLDESEEFVRTDILSIEFKDNSITAIVECLSDSDEPVTASTWEFTFRNSKKHRFQDSASVGFELAYQHPLLLLFNEFQSELYFNGKPESEARLLADIMTCHWRIVNDWFAVSEFLNQVPHFTGSFEFGLFAKGPDILMQQYERVLLAHNVPSNIINRQRPMIWNGSRFEDASADNAIFFIGESYVVANDISVQPL